MSAKKFLLLAACAVGCIGHTETAMAGKSDNCGESYSKSSYFVDAKSKWTYFEDVVAEIVEADGTTKVAFQTRSKMFELPAGVDAAFKDALASSLANKTKIHVAVDAAGGKSAPKPGGIAASKKLDRIQWASADKQHDSCR